MNLWVFPLVFFQKTRIQGLLTILRPWAGENHYFTGQKPKKGRQPGPGLEPTPKVKNLWRSNSYYSNPAKLRSLHFGGLAGYQGFS